MTTLLDFRTFALSNMMEVEHILSEVYTAHCAQFPDFMCFDGGAHKGFHTKRMAMLPGCRKVVAVEADPDMVPKLRASLAAADIDQLKIVVVPKALQRYQEEKTVSWRSSPSHVGRSSMLSESSDRQSIWDGKTDMEFGEVVTVPATTIDDLIADDDPKLAFIKTDLEGADLHALMGAGKTLEKHRPVLAFENSIHAPKVHNFTLDEVYTFFDKLGYVPMNFIGEPINAESWFGFFEAWAAPREHVDQIQSILNSAVQKRMSA